MAERRMFTKRITDDDHFSSLSSSAQALYLHLSMAADDDGFCNQVSIAMFKAHASTADLEQLLNNRYVYQFDNGVIVIKHWRMANALRKDRYTPTVFQEELSKLGIKENGSYTLDKSKSVQIGDGCQTVATWLPDGCQVVAERLPQDSIGKTSKDKFNVDKVNIGNRGMEEEPKTVSESTHKPSEIYESLIVRYLQMGNTAMANKYYNDAKKSGIEIDINEMKRKAGIDNAE